jgi:hypothetical protein
LTCASGTDRPQTPNTSLTTVTAARGAPRRKKTRRGPPAWCSGAGADDGGLVNAGYVDVLFAGYALASLNGGDDAAPGGDREHPARLDPAGLRRHQPRHGHEAI